MFGFSSTHIRSSANRPASNSPQQLPSAEWIRYFLHNRDNLLFLDWSLPVQMETALLRRIAPSIQEFQLGESSEGRRFLQRAEQWAAVSGDHDYVEALALFIAEEQRHGRDLGRFLQAAGVPLLTKSPVDGVFRFLRHLGGLEVSIVILLTAEIVAQVYYAALKAATDIPVLNRLCDQILHDEEKHVQFQSERLAILRKSRNPLLIKISSIAQAVLLAVTCCVLWRKHGPVAKAGGYSFSRFVTHTFACLKRSMEMANPSNNSSPIMSSRHSNQVVLNQK